MVTYIKAGIFGGIVLFIWSVVSWTILPWHTITIHNFKNEKAVSQIIRANAPTSGIYFMPSMKQNETAKNKEKRQEPMIFTAVHLEGLHASMTLPMLLSLATQIIAAFFVAWLLLRTKGLSYFNRVSFVMIFALAASTVTYIPYWTWFGFDVQYTLVSVVDLLIGWFLAGLILAKFCKK